MYMQYFCKNPKCNRIFLDEDVPGAITPQLWKYCDKCVEKFGFKNPRERPKRKLTENQLKNIRQRKQNNNPESEA